MKKSSILLTLLLLYAVPSQANTELELEITSAVVFGLCAVYFACKYKNCQTTLARNYDMFNQESAEINLVGIPNMRNLNRQAATMNSNRDLHYTPDVTTCLSVTMLLASLFSGLMALTTFFETMQN